jgi:hypothetical protein
MTDAVKGLNAMIRVGDLICVALREGNTAERIVKLDTSA